MNFQNSFMESFWRLRVSQSRDHTIHGVSLQNQRHKNFIQTVSIRGNRSKILICFSLRHLATLCQQHFCSKRSSHASDVFRSYTVPATGFLRHSRSYSALAARRTRSQPCLCFRHSRSAEVSVTSQPSSSWAGNNQRHEEPEIFFSTCTMDAYVLECRGYLVWGKTTTCKFSEFHVISLWERLA